MARMLEPKSVFGDVNSILMSLLAGYVYMCFYMVMRTPQISLCSLLYAVCARFFFILFQRSLPTENVICSAVDNR